MSVRRLFWIGSLERAQMAALEEEFEDLMVGGAPNAAEALNALIQDSGQFLITIIDVASSGMELGSLVRSVKEIKPAAEFIVLGDPALSWNNLNLPRYYRPILLKHPVSPDVLISCVAKLKEMVEAKEDYALLSKGIKGQIATSRQNTEALLTLLNRHVGVGVVSVRRDGFFTSYNSEAERMTGYTLDEVPHIQKWVQVLVRDPEKTRAAAAAIDRYWARGQGKEDIRLRLRRKDGRWINLTITILILLGDNGQPKQLVGLFMDPKEKWGTIEYRKLLESSPSAIYSYLPGEGFVHVSPSMINLVNKAFGLKLTEKDFLSSQIKDIPIPADDAERWRKYLEDTASDRDGGQEPIPPMGLPGNHILEHVFASHFSTGRQKGVIAMARERLDLCFDAFQDHTTEMLSSLTLNNIPYPFLLLKAVRGEDRIVKDFQCLSANPAAVRLLRNKPWSKTEVSLTELIPDKKALACMVDHAKYVTETGRDHEYEIRVMLATNDDAPLTIHFWLGKVGDGTAMFFRDVSAERAEETQLKQYWHIFAHMEEAIIVTDLEGNIIDWNPASERMFGYAKSQILGQSAFILTRTSKGDQLEQETRNILREGDVWKSEYEFARADGNRGVAFTVFAMIKDDQGKPYGTVGLCHDVTHRKRLEERLTLKTLELQEKNLALNTLLRHAEAERVRACEQVAADLSRRLMGRVNQIFDAKYKPELVDQLAQSLMEDLGGIPETKKLDRDDPSLKLTEKEMEVARLIRLGKTTEQIAFVLEKSPDTIRLQRISIRKKLGLTRRDRNLAGFLKRLDLT